MQKMKITVAAFLVGVLSAAEARVALVAPKEGESVCQLYPAQLAYLNTPRPERDKYFTDSAFSKAMRRNGSGPKPILLSWTGTSKAYRVTVKRLPDGKEFYSLSGETLADKAESYFLASGLTKENIAFLRAFLLQ